MRMAPSDRRFLFVAVVESALMAGVVYLLSTREARKKRGQL